MKTKTTLKKAAKGLSEADLEAAKDSLRRMKKNPIFLMPIERLRKNERNPNHMSAEAYAQLRENMKTHGFLQPVLVVNDGGDEKPLQILDGHHRVEVAQELGMTDVPCVLYEGDPKVAPIVGLSMNKLRGEIDMSEVASLLDGLAGVLPDEVLVQSGFSSEEIDSLLKAVQDSTADEEDVMEGATRGTEKADEDPVERPAILELTFSTTADMRRARKALRKAAGGKGGHLGEGLLRLIDGEE